MQIGYMVWRIGDILDPYQQLEWLAQNGFEAAGIHAAAGKPGIWQGVAPEADASARRRLRAAWQSFKSREVHAPIRLIASALTTPAEMLEFRRVLEFAGSIGADVVTIHGAAPKPPDDADQFDRILTALNTSAHELKIRIGIEITSGFEAFISRRWNQIGFTFDLGHMYLPGAGLAEPAAIIPPLIQRLGAKIFNVHLHDVDHISDHTEIGAGRVDFAGFFQALKQIKYDGAICLELNPARVAPEGILRSAACTRNLIKS